MQQALAPCHPGGGVRIQQLPNKVQLHLTHAVLVPASRAHAYAQTQAPVAPVLGSCMQLQRPWKRVLVHAHLHHCLPALLPHLDCNTFSHLPPSETPPLEQPSFHAAIPCQSRCDTLRQRLLLKNCQPSLASHPIWPATHPHPLELKPMHAHSQALSTSSPPPFTPDPPHTAILGIIFIYSSFPCSFLFLLPTLTSTSLSPAGPSCLLPHLHHHLSSQWPSKVLSPSSCFPPLSFHLSLSLVHPFSSLPLVHPHPYPYPRAHPYPHPHSQPHPISIIRVQSTSQIEQLSS